MLIPVTPVKRSYKTPILNQKDVLHKPFAFMSGKQAVFSCAREALFYGIRLLGNLPRRIHVPAYCCRSVLLPLEQLKQKIIFYDVGGHLEPILDETEFAKGDIFLLIHYFGIPQNTLYISRLCREYNMALVEDCAHALPDPEGENTMGTSGSFSIFSLRKHLPVPDGGVLVVNDAHLEENMKDMAIANVSTMSKTRWLVTNLDRLAFSLGWPNTLLLKDALRKVFGSTDNVFSARVYEECISEISHVTAMVLGQSDFKAISKVRRKNYRYLAENILDIRGFTAPFQDLPDGAVPQAFPVLVENVDSICAFMRKKGVGVGRWPGEEIPEYIQWSDFPGALRWVKSLLLLPSHQDLSTIYLEEIIRLFKKAI